MQDELPFRIELWNDDWTKRLETLAMAGDFRTAKAAYEEAVRRRPGAPILLCDRARIVLRAAGKQQS
jgi:cytochrome c-type biogenesis protein CcmH/NrfG